MNNNKNIYAGLSKRRLEHKHILALGDAIQELAKTFTAHSIWDSLRNTTQCIKYINKFRGDVLPVSTLTDDEAELSANLHTYMRKCMDCPLGTILYRLISENKGTSIWYSFVQGVYAEKSSVRMFKKPVRNLFYQGIQAAKKEYNNANCTTDDLLMLSALEMWEADFSNAIEWICGDDSEGNAGTC